MLIDGKTIVLAAKHLTKIQTIELNFNKAKINSLSDFAQYLCRNDIIALLNAIKLSTPRLDFFCQLPDIISDGHNQRWNTMKKRTIGLIDVPPNFDEILLTFYCHLKREKLILLDEDIRLIAEAIQNDKYEMALSTPVYHQVCGYCFQPNDLITCNGQCKGFFHQSCIAQPSQRRSHDSRMFCMNCRDRNKQKSKRVAKVDKCRLCRTSTNDRIACIKCCSSFHSTAACIPAGASLLSQTQLICCCCATNLNDGIILTGRTKNWPAIIVSMHQVPQEIFQNINIHPLDPGVAFVFLIGKNEYKEVKTSNCISFRTAKIPSTSDFHFQIATEIAAALVVR